MSNFYKTPLILILFTLINIYVLIYNYNPWSENNYELKQEVDPSNVDDKTFTKLKHIERYFGRDDSRDFFRYKCKNMKRIGGEMRFIQAVPDALYRFFIFIGLLVILTVFFFFRPINKFRYFEDFLVIIISSPLGRLHRARSQSYGEEKLWI